MISQIDLTAAHRPFVSHGLEILPSYYCYNTSLVLKIKTYPV